MRPLVYPLAAAATLGLRLHGSGPIGAQELLGAWMVATAVMAVLGRFDQLRLNHRHKTLFGAELSKEEGRVCGTMLFFVFAASSAGEGVPAIALVQRGAPLIAPGLLLCQGLRYGAPDARAILLRIGAYIAVGAGVLGATRLGSPAWLHAGAGAASVLCSIFFIVRSGTRQLRRNRLRNQQGQSNIGQRPRVITNLVRDVSETGFGFTLLLAGGAEALTLVALFAVPALAGAFNAACLIELLRSRRHADQSPSARERHSPAATSCPVSGSASCQVS